MKRLRQIRKNDAIADAQARYATEDLMRYIPEEVGLLENPQTAIPRIAKDRILVQMIEAAVQRIPTSHNVCLGDGDISPDGKKFLMIKLAAATGDKSTEKTTAAGPRRINIVVNWLDELKQRVPVK